MLHSWPISGEIVAITDIPFHVWGNNSCYATAKIVALNSLEGKSYMAASMGLPSGMYKDCVCFCNMQNNERVIFSKNGWRRLEEEPVGLDECDLTMLSLSTMGLTLSEMAELMNMSADGVKSVRRRLFEKLGSRNIVQALSCASNYNVISNHLSFSEVL